MATQLKSFFDNLNCFFNDDETYSADVPATVHKNINTGEIEEIRIYIPDYDQFIYITKTGTVNLINIPEEEETRKSKKK